MSNGYTGMVKVVLFQGPKGPDDQFALVLHQNGEDRESLANILLRYKEDGYTVARKVDRWMRNGHLVRREEENEKPSLGFRARSAFLRS